MTLHTLKTFDHVMEAHLLKSKLEDEGIYSFLKDEFLVGLDPLYANALGGIKLQVNKNDWEKALNILAAINQSYHMQILACPQCDSVDYYENYKSFKSVKGLLALCFSFLFLAYPIYHKYVRKCKKCGLETAY